MIFWNPTVRNCPILQVEKYISYLNGFVEILNLFYILVKVNSDKFCVLIWSLAVVKKKIDFIVCGRLKKKKKKILTLIDLNI